MINKCAKCEGVYKNLFVGGNELVRRCYGCKDLDRVKLPSLNRKIIYLDQNFLSALYRKEDKGVMEIGRQLQRLSASQQISISYSVVHEIESRQCPDGHGGELLNFIKDLARGRMLEPDSKVEMAQLLRAFLGFIDQSNLSDIKLKKDDAIPRSFNEWGRMPVLSNRDHYSNEVNFIEQLKREYSKRLVDCFELWSDKKEKKDFNTIFNEECRGLANVLRTALCESIAAYSSPDPLSFLDAPSNDYLRQLISLPKNRGPIEERIKHVMLFLDSEYFRATPYVRLSAEIFTVLRQKIQDGQYANREKAKEKFRGIFYDAKFISVYAPYCDVIYIDNTMRQWLRSGNIALEKRYPVRLFSKENIKEMGRYLQEIEDGITPDLRLLIKQVYPGFRDSML